MTLHVNQETLADRYINLYSLESEKALEYQKEALELREKILGREHPSLAISYANISRIYMENENFSDAKLYIDKSVKIFNKLYPNGHPSLDVVLRVQKWIYSN